MAPGFSLHRNSPIRTENIGLSGSVDLADTTPLSDKVASAWPDPAELSRHCETLLQQMAHLARATDGKQTHVQACTADLHAVASFLPRLAGQAGKQESSRPDHSRALVSPEGPSQCAGVAAAPSSPQSAKQVNGNGNGNGNGKLRNSWTTSVSKNDLRALFSPKPSLGSDHQQKSLDALLAILEPNHHAHPKLKGQFLSPTQAEERRRVQLFPVLLRLLKDLDAYSGKRQEAILHVFGANYMHSVAYHFFDQQIAVAGIDPNDLRIRDARARGAMGELKHSKIFR